jgi:hypothetical protein
MGLPLFAQDANLIVSGNLPTATATTTSSAAIDLGMGPFDQFAAERVNFTLSVPALAVGHLPDGDTVTYTIWSSPNANLSSPVEYIPAALVQTGAAGAGAAANTFTFAVPSTINRYLFAKATTGAGAAAAASTPFTLAAQF